MKEQIPSDRVKDAAALARELRWRARQAGGYTSDDEGKKAVNGFRGVKRRRPSSENTEMEEPVRFKNFKPRQWDSVKEEVNAEENKTVKVTLPEDLETWREEVEGDADAEVKSRRILLVKMRKTEQGLEREIVERRVEEWQFGR